MRIRGVFMEELTKENRIRKEERKLKKYFKALPKNQLEIATPLIQNAAFMKVTLEDLQAEINKNGVSEVYTNGKNQKGIKPSAAASTYNTMFKNYEKVSQRLQDMLPEEVGKSKLAELMKE